MIVAYNFNHSCKPSTSLVKNPVIFSGSAIPNSFVIPIDDAGLDIVNARPEMEIVITPMTVFNLVVFVASAANQQQYTRIVKRMYTPRQGRPIIITRRHIQDILTSFGSNKVKAITFNNANQENEQPEKSQTIRTVNDFINEARKLIPVAPPAKSAPMDYYMRTGSSPCKPGYINIRDNCSYFEEILTEVIGDETKHISCKKHPGKLDVCYDENQWQTWEMTEYYPW